MTSSATPRFDTELGAFAFWPDDTFWSFQFVRLLGQIPVGGADFAELFDICRDIEAGDVDAWFEGFTKAAHQLDRDAERSIAAGNVRSACGALLRACNYHRASGFFLDVEDPRHEDAIAARRESFRRAGELSDPMFRPVEIPYADRQSLPGYLFPASGAATATASPGVVMFGGTDAVAEEMYFALGRALSERGFHVLAFDGPGQGEALRRGMHGRHDWEVPAAAAYDFLAAQDGVDPSRIAIVGQSLGGHLAARAAGYDQRYAACIVWGAIFDLRTVVRDGLATGDPGMAFFQQLWQRILGLPDIDGVLDALEPYSLREVAGNITCPTLVLHGESDTITPLADAHQLMEHLTVSDRRLIQYPAGTPGRTHCQLDAVLKVDDDIVNFLSARLGPTDAATTPAATVPQVHRDHLDAVTGGATELADIWEPDGTLAFPYAVNVGSAQQLDGVEEITGYFSQLGTFTGFTISNLQGWSAGPREWVAEFHASGTIAAASAPYEQDYLVRFGLSSRGRLAWMREFWDPTRMSPIR